MRKFFLSDWFSKKKPIVIFFRSAISLNSTQKTLKMAPELSKNKSQSGGKKSSIKDNRPKMIRHSSFPSPKKSIPNLSKTNPASREMDPVDEVDNGGRYIPRTEDGTYSKPCVTIYDAAFAMGFHVR